MQSNKIKIYVGLHILLMVYSVNTIFSKLASRESMLSFKWCLYYAGVIFLLGVYAVGWQQIIKRLPLTLAFANKAVTVVWGLIWGKLFFEESITLGKSVGAAIIMLGVILFAFSETEDSADE